MIGYDEEELEELDLKELMKQDIISQMMEEFSKIAPSAATVLILEQTAVVWSYFKRKGQIVFSTGTRMKRENKS